MVWDINPVLIDFGAVKIHYYGVIFATGILIGYFLWRWQMLDSPLFCKEDFGENFFDKLQKANDKLSKYLKTILKYELDEYAKNKNLSSSLKKRTAGRINEIIKEELLWDKVELDKKKLKGATWDLIKKASENDGAKQKEKILHMELVRINRFILIDYYPLETENRVKRRRFSEKDTEDFVIWAFLAVIIGARLGHCLFYEPGFYLNHPIEILFFWKGGLASHGAAIALLLTLFVYHKVKKIPLLLICDCFSFSAAVGATAVRIGNFFNSEIVGRVTNVPWAVKFPRYAYIVGNPEPLPRHPSQLYEVALGLTVLLVLFLANRYYKEKRPTGLLGALFLITYFSGRFFVEYFKEYQTLQSSSALTMGQYLSIPFILAGFILLIYSFVTHKKHSLVKTGEIA